MNNCEHRCPCDDVNDFLDDVTPGIQVGIWIFIVVMLALLSLPVLSATGVVH